MTGKAIDRSRRSSSDSRANRHFFCRHLAERGRALPRNESARIDPPTTPLSLPPERLNGHEKQGVSGRLLDSKTCDRRALFAVKKGFFKSDRSRSISNLTT